MAVVGSGSASEMLNSSTRCVRALEREELEGIDDFPYHRGCVYFKHACISIVMKLCHISFRELM